MVSLEYQKKLKEPRPTLDPGEEKEPSHRWRWQKLREFLLLGELLELPTTRWVDHGVMERDEPGEVMVAAIMLLLSGHLEEMSTTEVISGRKL